MMGWNSLSGGLCLGVSARAGLCLGSLCLGGLCLEISVQGRGLCPGKGSSEVSMSSEVSV